MIKSLHSSLALFVMGGMLLLTLSNCTPKAADPSSAPGISTLHDMKGIILCKDKPEKCIVVENRIKAYHRFLEKIQAPSIIDPSNDTLQINGKVVEVAKVAEDLDQLLGYEFSTVEIMDMAVYASVEQCDSIFFMSAVNEEARSQDEKIHYLDMYIWVEKNARPKILVGRVPGATSDFPQPCPNSCPTLTQ